jgi:transposase InsO family protein
MTSKAAAVYPFTLRGPRGVIEQLQGIEPVPLPPKSPNLNAPLERFFGSLKSECLERMIFFGETMLRRAIRQSLEHYHAERHHQGLANHILQPGGRSRSR